MRSVTFIIGVVLFTTLINATESKAQPFQPKSENIMTQPDTTQSTAVQPTSETEIRPFRVNIPDEALTDLKRRLAATKWPERELVADGSQGVQLETMKKLVDYWSAYDWRKTEAKLNSYPQFITKIDGVDIHFIHVRSKKKRRAYERRYRRKHYPLLANEHGGFVGTLILGKQAGILCSKGNTDTYGCQFLSE